MIDPIQGKLITLITNSEIKKRNELLIIAPQGLFYWINSVFIHGNSRIISSVSDLIEKGK
jgi:hypothetical protein